MKQRETLQTVLFLSYSASLLVPGGAVVAMGGGAEAPTAV